LSKFIEIVILRSYSKSMLERFDVLLPFISPFDIYLKLSWESKSFKSIAFDICLTFNHLWFFAKFDIWELIILWLFLTYKCYYSIAFFNSEALKYLNFSYTFFYDEYLLIKRTGFIFIRFALKSINNILSV